MQQFRLCSHRYVSYVNYKIFNSIAARKAHINGVYDMYLKDILGTENATSCIKNETCFHNSSIYINGAFETRKQYDFVTGNHSCIASHKSKLESCDVAYNTMKIALEE